MSEGSKSLDDDQFMERPVPSRVLWEALVMTLEVFGPSMKEATLLELKNSGLDLENDNRDHSLADLGEKLSSIFGKDGTDVILEQIGKKLKHRST